MKHTLEKIKNSFYFVPAREKDTCDAEGECLEPAVGCLYLYYDWNDDGTSCLPMLCEKHLLEDADENWGELKI